MSAATTPEVAWLAACAMGLAYSGMGTERRTEMVGDAADWDAELLEAAHRAVATFDVGDRTTRGTAAELLLDALARTRRGPAPATADAS